MHIHYFALFSPLPPVWTQIKWMGPSGCLNGRAAHANCINSPIFQLGPPPAPPHSQLTNALLHTGRGDGASLSGFVDFYTSLFCVDSPRNTDECNGLLWIAILTICNVRTRLHPIIGYIGWCSRNCFPWKTLGKQMQSILKLIYCILD